MAAVLRQPLVTLSTTPETKTGRGYIYFMHKLFAEQKLRLSQRSGEARSFTHSS
jgi:hypothetical protein